MAACLTALLTLLLLLISPLQCQEKENSFTGSGRGTDSPGQDVILVDGENLNPAGSPTVVLNKDWPKTPDELTKVTDQEERTCEIVPITDGPPVMAEPETPAISPAETPAVPQPALPPLTFIPVVPNNRNPALLPSGGAVVPVQGGGGWFVPGQGLYLPVQVLPYPPGLPQYQIPLTYGRISHMRRGVPHPLFGLRRPKSSEEYDE